MENSGYAEGFPDMHTATSSDEDLVEIAGATLDFSSTDDVPPLDRDYGSGTVDDQMTPKSEDRNTCLAEDS